MQSSEHRVSTRGTKTVNTAKYGRIQLGACPRWLEYKSPHSASRAVGRVGLVEHLPQRVEPAAPMDEPRDQRLDGQEARAHGPAHRVRVKPHKRRERGGQRSRDRQRLIEVRTARARLAQEEAQPVLCQGRHCL